MHLNYKNTIQYQLPLKRKLGGFGLRSPNNYYIASKITALSNKIDIVKNYFRFEFYDDSNINLNDNLINPNILKLNKIFYNSQNRLDEYIDELYRQFNTFIGLDLFINRLESININY